jgi:hypothetical protein
MGKSSKHQRSKKWNPELLCTLLTCHLSFSGDLFLKKLKKSHISYLYFYQSLQLISDASYLAFCRHVSLQFSHLWRTFMMWTLQKVKLSEIGLFARLMIVSACNLPFAFTCRQCWFSWRTSCSDLYEKYSKISTPGNRANISDLSVSVLSPCRFFWQGSWT